MYNEKNISPLHAAILLAIVRIFILFLHHKEMVFTFMILMLMFVVILMHKITNKMKSWLVEMFLILVNFGGILIYSPITKKLGLDEEKV